MKSSEFDAWKKRISEKIDKVGLSEIELAGFFLVLKGFSQAGQDLNINANVVFQALKERKFKIWSKTFTISPEEFFAIDFTSDKWLSIVGSAMNALHARAGIHPKNLLFLDAQDKNITAATMFATVQHLTKDLWESQK